MQKLVIRLACFEADMIYYKEEELVGTYILRTQLFLKVRLMEEIIGFSMPCLKLVTSETLIAPLKEKDMRDLLSELLVFSDKSMELHVSWKLFKKGYCRQLLRKAWINIIEIEVQEVMVDLEIPVL